MLFRDQVEQFSLLMYRRMLLSDDWGMATRDSVQFSYARHLLKLPANHEFDYADYERFLQLLDQKMTEYGLLTLSLAAIDERLETYAFELEGRTFGVDDVEDLSAFSRESACDFVLQGGYHGDHVEMILGTGTRRMMGGFLVTDIEEEWVVTPTLFVSIAAMIAYKYIYVRKPSLSTLFYFKWMAFFNNPSPLTTSVAARISVGLKHRAISGRNLPECEQEFVDELYETVLFHELGHGVIQHVELPEKVATLAEGSQVFGVHVGIDLLEILADVAPCRNGVSGPLWHICEVAAQDPTRAQRLFWMYWSDAWFFDTPDDYMYGYSGYVSLMMAEAIVDGGVDFDRLALTLERVRPWVLDCVGRFADQFFDLIRNTDFVSDVGESSSLEDYLSLCMTQDPPSSFVLKEPYLIQVWRYEKALGYIKSLPAGMDAVEAIFARTGRDLESGFFEVVTGMSLANNVTYQQYLEQQLRHLL